MGEEIRNPGTELNEAALEGVSGGLNEKMLQKATQVCGACQHKMDKSCNVPVEDLARYMQNERTVGKWIYCPFQPSMNR